MPLNTFISLVFLLLLLPCHCSFALWLRDGGFLISFLRQRRACSACVLMHYGIWLHAGLGPERVSQPSPPSSESGASSSAHRETGDRNLRPLSHKITFSDGMCVFMMWHLPSGSSMLDLVASKDQKTKHAWVIWDFWCNSEFIYTNKLQ